MRLKHFTKSIILSTMLLMLTSSQALAESGSISAVQADAVSGKLVGMVKSILMPFGSLVILIAVVVSAFKIITSANKPEDRAKAMSALPYIIGGGLLLGGSMLVAGLIIGQWTQLS